VSQTSLYQVQADALISQLKKDQEATVRKLEQAAMDWNRQRLREARHQALLQFRKAAAMERERFSHEISAAEAAIAAEARTRHQQHLSAMVQAVIDRLPWALEQRWQSPLHRSEWIDSALRNAGRRLGDGAWLIRVAPGSEQDKLPESSDGASIRWQTDPSLKAGLLIEQGGARLDASIPGLLADPPRVQSYVLTLLGEVRGGGRTHV
jgi:hypothetical protein